jgi:hypothetical protein
MFLTYDVQNDDWTNESSPNRYESTRSLFSPRNGHGPTDPRYDVGGLIMLSTPFERSEFFDSITDDQATAMGIKRNSLHGGPGCVKYPVPMERHDKHHAWAVPYGLTSLDDDPSKQRILQPDGHNYWVQEPRWMLPDESEIMGWLLCHLKKGTTPHRAIVERCMRISVIINLLQRPDDLVSIADTFDWFSKLDQWVGMPRIPDDEEPNDLAWEDGEGRAIDPLSLLNSGEVARLWNFTLAAGEMEDSDVEQTNTHTQMRLSRFLPYRIVRVGTEPHPFAFSQAIGFTDLETLHFASHLIRTPLLELEGTYDGDKPGDVILSKCSAVDLHHSLFDLKKRTRYPRGSEKRFRNWSVYTSPTIMARQSIDAPFIIGNGVHKDTGENVYGFSSYYDGYAHRLAEDFAHHDSCDVYFKFLGSEANGELWTPTWKDRRPLKVLDYAKPFPTVWSDLVRCVVCNQRVRILFSKDNTVPSVCCPSCKAEDGIKTEHLMSGDIPAVLGISSTTDGTTIME